jgi:peptidoglycan/xylan/chitin deacetylase (PgdA/CDA1 family)
MIKIKKRITQALACLFIFFGIAYFLESIYVFPILMYHSMNEDTGGSKIVITPGEFASQMDFLAKHGFRVIGLDEVASLVKSRKRISRKTVAITFDDGYEDNYIYAYPVLKKYNFPATIFVIVDSIGKDGYLREEQLKEMYLNKINIGSHSLTHRWLPEVQGEDLIKEIFDSKKTLSNFLNKEVKFFCYPVGGFNEKIKGLVKAAGYLAACTTSPGRKFPDRDIFALKRVRISGGKNHLLVFRIKISGYHTWIKEHRDED